MKETIIIQSGVNMEAKIETLKKVKIDVGSYSTYYIDLVTDEKWVKEHPEGELHAGGPPQLRLIDKFPWEE